MEEFFYYIEEETNIELDYILVGNRYENINDMEHYVVLKYPFENGKFREDNANYLISYLKENNIKFYGNINTVGGTLIN